jgi:phage terminase large subunit-like protein
LGVARGDRAIKWIEDHCIIPDGLDLGKQVKLREWQRENIRKIYDNPAGTRRAILSFGRKNAKTTFSAFLLLLHLCGPEARRNSQLFSAAQSREQAAIIFDLASKIVRMSPSLRDFVTIRDTAKQLLCPELGTLYRALSAEASTAYGFSPVFVVHDELGQVVGDRSALYDALETAAGAQANPLSIIISTQAPTDADLLSVLIDDAQRGSDPRTVVSLYTCPIDHPEPFGRGAIELANPALGDFLNEEETFATAADAQRMSSKESSYRNLILNQRVVATDPFVSRSVWDSCGAPPLPFPDGVQVWGGLDLSAVHDLTALVLVGCVNGVWQVHPTFWLPEVGIREKSQRDRVQWDQFHKEGGLELTPGKSVDYEWVAQILFDLFQKYNIVKIAFDRWRFEHLKPCLIRVGFHELLIEERFMPFGQGYASMAPALDRLERDIINQRIAHGKHPVLNMCAANAVVTRDPAGNRKLDKAKSSGRIDGLVALAMAMGAAPGDDPDLLSRSIIERGGLP